MGLADLKFTEAELLSGQIGALADRPNDNGLTASQLKAYFDKLSHDLTPEKFNDLIDEIIAAPKVDIKTTTGKFAYTHDGSTQGETSIISSVDTSANIPTSGAVKTYADTKTTEAYVQSYAEPKKGSDDNFVTDAEKVKLSNLSGTNTGDQSATDFDIKDLTDSTNLRTEWSGKQDKLTAGDNISITDNVISSTDTTYSATDFDIKDLSDTTGKRAEWDAKIDGGDLIGSNIAITDTAGYFTGDNAETIFAEIGLVLDGVLTLLEGI